MEKWDEKMLLLHLVPIEMGTSQWIIRKNTNDRSLFIVGSGEVTIFGRTTTTIKDGGIFGCHEFVTGNKWEVDVICNKAGTLLKLDYDTFTDLVDTSSKAAANIWRRVVKRLCWDMID